MRTSTPTCRPTATCRSTSFAEQAVERGHHRDRDHRPCRLRARRAGVSVHDVRAARAHRPGSGRALGRSRRGHPVRRRAHLRPSVGGRHPRAPRAITPTTSRSARGTSDRARRTAASTSRPGSPDGRSARSWQPSFDEVGGRSHRPLRYDRPSRRRQALSRAARDGRRSRRRAGAVRADPPRPRRERDRAGDQYERAAPGGRRDLPARRDRGAVPGARRRADHDRLGRAPRRHLRVGARRRLPGRAAAGFEPLTFRRGDDSVVVPMATTPNAVGGRSL